MTTPYRGYTELPGAAVPDVPYRVNLALREIDADVADAVAELETTDAAQAGRLAALESAAGFGAGMQLQDDAVNSLLLGNTKAAATLTKQIDNRGPAATVAALAVPASPTREAFDDFVIGHMGDYFHGPMQEWGTALRAQKTKPALWVSLGSSTANGGNTDDFAYSWVGRIAAYLTGRRAAVEALAGARPTSGVHVYNGAQGGTESSNYLNADRIAAIKKLQPTLITHMVGANDFGGNVALNTYKANLRNWKDQLDAASPSTVHLYIHQQGRVAGAPGSLTWNQYGAAMREVADAYPNAMFLNAGERFTFRDGLEPNLVSDNLHMNERGHRIMADLVAEAMGNPIAYAPKEYYRDPLTVGGAVTATVDFSNLQIPAAPYPRILQVNANLYAYGTGAHGATGPDLEYRVFYMDTAEPELVDGMLAARIINGGVGYAQVYAASPTYRIAPNRPVKLNIRNAGALYFSNNGAYSRLNVVTDPF